MPVISVTVLAFSACLVELEPNWKMAFKLSDTLAGSYSVCSARAVKAHIVMMAASAIRKVLRMMFPEEF
ncbi:hypothetical protein ACVWWG_002925 [Bradyrhizobium sp. LB7.2]